MRILITTTPGARNFGPVRTFAQAWQRLGHEVMVVVDASAAGMVSDAGLDFQALDPQARLDLKVAYEGIAAAIGAVRPDLVVHETAEYATVLAGEATGVPVARVAVVSGTQERAAAAVAAPTVDSLRAELGLARDPEGARILSGRGITLIPAALEDPAARVSLERFRGPKPWPRRMPDLWHGDTSPLAHLSLGARQMAVHRSAIEQLASLQMRVLVSLGAGQDPAELGPLPGGAHVNPGMPLIDTMPYTAVLVCDGASSTLTAGLSCGVPMVSVPLSSGQALNANAMAETGAGLALEGGAAAVGAMASSVRAMLRSRDYRTAAEAVAAEIAALPPVEDALAPSLTSA
jgi:UDP:flavonoid glycosyltransferase YjiC (YdhE family)